MRTALIVAGIALLGVFGWAALTKASPDDGIEHGGNPCSPAIFDALGVGSRDEDSSAVAGAGEPTELTEVKGTIEYCESAARRRIALAAIPLALGIVVLRIAWRGPRDLAESTVQGGGTPVDTE